MLEYIKIKNYKHPQKLIDLWNKEFKNVCSIEKSYYVKKVLEDPNFNKEISLIAVYDNVPVGFIFVKTWLEDSGLLNDEAEAHISLIFVKKEMRNMGIGSDMLKIVFDELKKDLKIRRIEVGNDINSLLPGVPSELPGALIFFVNKGFVQREGVVDMIKVVKNETFEDLSNEEYVIRVATEEDKDAILKLCTKNNWGRSAYLLNIYFESGGSGRRIILCLKDDEIVGFARIYETNESPLKVNFFFKDNNVGCISFLGVDNEHKGKGLDTLLVKACSNYLIKRGCKKILVPSTKKVQYYKKLGFSAFKYYQRFDIIINT